MDKVRLIVEVEKYSELYDPRLCSYKVHLNNIYIGAVLGASGELGRSLIKALAGLMTKLY